MHVTNHNCTLRMLPDSKFIEKTITNWKKPSKLKLKLTTTTTENNNNKQHQMSEPTISKLIDKLKTYPRI